MDWVLERFPADLEAALGELLDGIAAWLDAGGLLGPAGATLGQQLRSSWEEERSHGSLP